MQIEDTGHFSSHLGYGSLDKTHIQTWVSLKSNLHVYIKFGRNRAIND